MKNKKMMGAALVFLLGMSVPTYFVWADDHEYEEYDEHEDEYEDEEYGEHESEYEYEYEDHLGDDDDDDDDEYEYDYEDWQQAPVEIEPDVSWDVWSRTLSAGQGTLPFAISQMVTIENSDGKQLESYVIPKQGQIMVPAVKVAEFLGANVIYYKTSKIAEIQLDGNELVFKSNSNAVYENNEKTPMPVEAMMYQNELYIPISVLTNGFSFSVTWNETKQTFLIGQ